ncbi:MAG: 3-deoxy-manno-octulosonate cytidylyltransferase [Holosporaceae bacterium]|jgi:3-deoxy-manno-octulosonate cytidylyltransferase (CMP-KDO synthetase)|nr:3-deoxy-manno-octulosonate cytidylyltransferase [Holosporaceae bacterium]
MSTLIVIPARISSSRLERKMLADIGGEPLIVRTHRCAIAAAVGDVVVACDGEEIADVIRSIGGTAIVTDPKLPSGTDRVFSARSKYDPDGKYDLVINVQGDMPFVAPEFIRRSDHMLRTSNYDMVTLATPIGDESYRLESCVKPVIAFGEQNQGKAIYFSRSPVPFGGPYYHHVGIYGFRSEALARFVALPPSALEQTEKLEQLRALENGMSIGIEVLELPPPISVDTPADLEAARSYCAAAEPIVW